MTTIQPLHLYRRYLRLALSMPDPHRRRLVAFRAREEFERSRNLPAGSDLAASKLLELDVLADNLALQATHLNRLAVSPESLMVPVDLRAGSSGNRGKESRRTVVDLVTKRETEAQRGRSRFMKGPEPSWLRQAKDK